MKRRTDKNNKWIMWMLVLIVIFSSVYAFEPSAPTNYTYVSNESPQPSVGTMFNQSGGTINVVNFDVTTQNPRWKGFVGNITGKYGLMDSNNMALYDWSLTTVKGEIYATRQSTLVDWSEVECASSNNITTEENELNFNESDEDNINNTFISFSHNEFYAGDKLIAEDSCPSTFLYVGGLAQAEDFQELLLMDESIIYTGMLENATRGYSNATYDYQLMVPENTALDAPSEVYYIYIELV